MTTISVFKLNLMISIGQRGGERGITVLRFGPLSNPNRNFSTSRRLVTTYSNFEIYSSCRHNYIVRNRRLLKFPAAYYSFSSSPEPSPRPLSSMDKLFIIGYVTTVLGLCGWYVVKGVKPCSSFISSSTSHLSNCCRCYNHCSCVPDEQEEKKFDAIATDEIVTKTFWTVVVVYAVIFVRFICRAAIAKYRSGSAHLLQIGILDKKRIFQRKLHIIAENSDTSTLKGRIYVLKEVLQENSDLPMEQSIKPCYRELLSREQGKRFDKATKLVAACKASFCDNAYVVVTILVLTRGGYSLPSLKLCAENIKSNLRAFLCSLPPKKIQDANVFWTPQTEDYMLPEQILVKNFPRMKRIS